MIEIYEKRGNWCYRDQQGKLFKFNTEAEAKSSLGYLEPKEFEYASEKENEEGEEKTNTYKQETVFNSKSSNKKKV